MQGKFKDQQVKEIYDNLAENMRREIQDNRLFDTLFSPESLSLKTIQGGVATFVTDSSYSAQVLNANFASTIQQKLCQILETDVRIEILDRSTYNKKSSFAEKSTDTFFKSAKIHSHYTFENFVIGPNNRDAYLASLLAVENPARSNPIFLYSNSGLGKTHLLQAIGNAYKNKNPEHKVLYISSEDFIAEFIRFVKGNKESEELRDFFENVDLLLIDDIQLFKGKEQTQQMFFTIFNLLVSNEKQIVMTSDRAPSELDGLQDRLVSRFSGGLTINIKAPNKETMIEILKMKIRVANLPLEDFEPEVLDYLAYNYSKNVRELEGSLTNLLFAITTNKIQGKITIEFTRSVFEHDEIRKKKNQNLSVDTIIEIVADHYSLTPNQLKSKVRTSQIALVRQIAMYLSRQMLNVPYAEIGKKFGGKDHSTVLANCQKIQSMLATDNTLKVNISKLEEIIKNSVQK